MQKPEFPKSSVSSQQQNTKSSVSSKQKTTKAPNSTPIDFDAIRQKMNFPTPEELLSHYESKGLNSHDASIKAIDDLQYMIFKVFTKNKGIQDKSILDASRKLDTSNARLAVIEMKLDTKPGYPQSVAIGVASAAAFRGITAIWPQLASAAFNIWNSVRGSRNT